MRKNSAVDLSIIIPARNEEKNIGNCAGNLISSLSAIKDFSYEIIIVNNNSTDSTQDKINLLRKKHPGIIMPVFEKNPGFGNAVRAGLKNISGEYFCLVMADYSDDPEDLKKMISLVKQRKYDAIYTNRFRRKGLADEYPRMKLFFNRLGNNLVALLYLTRFNDLTNAFKIIRTRILDGYTIKASGFELTIELALLSLSRGKSFKEVDVRWYNRKEGEAFLKLHKALPRYLRPIICFIPYRYRILRFR